MEGNVMIITFRLGIPKIQSILKITKTYKY
jgi:hypothetical protein